MPRLEPAQTSLDLEPSPTRSVWARTGPRLKHHTQIVMARGLWDDFDNGGVVWEVEIRSLLLNDQEVIDGQSTSACPTSDTHQAAQSLTGEAPDVPAL